MKKNKNFNKIIKFSFFFIFLTSFGFVITKNKDIDFLAKLKKSIPQKTKYKIKKYIFPFSYINELEKTQLSSKYKYKQTVTNLSAKSDLYLKESLSSLEFSVIKKDQELNEISKKLRTYSPTKNKLSYGIYNPYPGSAYLEYYDDNIFIMSSVGILGYSKVNDKKLSFIQIQNNIGQYFGLPELVGKVDKEYNASIKDIKIFDNNIFTSLTREIKKNCWNLTILRGVLNYKEVNFKPIYSPKECIDSTKFGEKEFRISQSGGRIINLDKNNIIFSIGEFRDRKLAQDKLSEFGKIIKLNLKTLKKEIISIGHRNPQGLLHIKNLNSIISTEHGPLGGDEVNIFKLDQAEIPNFGWSISSYGEHYGDVVQRNRQIYNKFPLYKSHKKYGFKEPLIYFTPSIGISEIIQIGSKKFLFSSLKDKSIYIFDIEDKYATKNLMRIKIGERIRDIINTKEGIFLFLEDTSSIGKIKL